MQQQYLTGFMVSYLNGSGKVGFHLAEVDEPSNCYSVRKVVDERHVVDQVVCLSDAKNKYRGDALWEDGDVEMIPSVLTISGLRIRWTVLTQTNSAGIGVQFFKWIMARRYGR